jgi:signal peptidase I
MSQKRSTTREYLEALLVAGLFLGFTNTFLFKTFFIPSSSMEPTLLIGDHLIVNRFVYGMEKSEDPPAFLPTRPVQRGDIVVFRSPEEPRTDLVKRCVGLPGDVIDFRDKRLFLDDEPVADDFTVHRDPAIGGRTTFDPRHIRRDQFGPYEVPEGHYFCIGDNRDLSHDSRFWGPVPAELVKGRVSVIYWSYGGETSDGQWRGLGDKLAHLARTAAGFVTKSRWNRTFHVPR